MIDINKLIDSCRSQLVRIGLVIRDPFQYKITNSRTEVGALDWPRNADGNIDPTGVWTLEISNYHLNDPEDEIRSTIFHEFAHYFAYLKLMRAGKLWVTPAGVFTSYLRFPFHGSDWRKICNYISDKLNLSVPITTYADKEDDSDLNYKEPKYLLVCNDCGADLYETDNGEEEVIRVVKAGNFRPDGTKRYKCNACHSSNLYVKEF